LATTGTIESARFAALLDHFGRGVRVVTRSGRGLVEHVEQGDFSSPRLRTLLAEHLQVLVDAGADVVVLGCTHYVFLRPLAQEILGPDIQLIDTGLAVARQLQRKLLDAGLASANTQPGSVDFWCSGKVDRVSAALQQLWPAVGTTQMLPPSKVLSG